MNHIPIILWLVAAALFFGAVTPPAMYYVAHWVCSIYPT